ncbi:hypothetical protein [Halorarum salinum]|uniref:DUF7978 domain-containing protein n=1 Tax=Halorarum salinum TaxID=2743089 RepID=A0A7D5LAJ8_9EURY|nr:hypothetical protein [Halobaculum salinum]QLG61891.1 hypothetical protein HUG12_09230 [Halobaculum salinum]
MIPSLRRSLAGATAAVLAYVLTAILAVPWLPRLLGRGGNSPRNLWPGYETAGEPAWAAIGWVLLAAHRVPLQVASPDSTFVGYLPLGTAPWLFLCGPLACFVVGAVVVQHADEDAAIPAAVGAYLFVGYLISILLGAFVFRVSTGQTLITPALWNTTSLSWMVVVPLVPLAFGTAGAYVGSEPAIKAALPTWGTPS